LIFGASWGDDNQIVFAPRGPVGLSQVSIDGGKPETLITPDKSKGEFGHRLPYYLPAGRGILFTIIKQSFDLEPLVAVMNLTTRRWRVLLEDAAESPDPQLPSIFAAVSPRILFDKPIITKGRPY
jgi:hypothetical protein